MFNKNIEVVKPHCPFCGKAVDINNFRDELSLKEFQISGLCQSCQDDFFD